MNEERVADFNKAQTYALKVLQTRPRSVYEIKQKMQDRDYSNQAIDQVIEQLIDYNYLNDADFATSWFRYRLKMGWGRRRVILELKRKGLSQDHIDYSIQQEDEDYNELETIKQLALARMKRYDNIEPSKLKKRLYDFLTRRGFGFDVIKKVLQEIL